MRVQANRSTTETRTRQKPVSLPPLGLAVLLAGVITLAGCGTSRPPEAAAPAEAALTVPALYDPGPPQYAGSVRESKYLTMRDGVKIAIDVHLPEGIRDGQKLPAILWQTRYWRSMETRWPFGWFVDEPRDYVREPLEAFVARGYAWVAVDARGSGASYGSRPYPWSRDETRDGAEMVDWIVAQPWSNGKVGTFGTSYDGTTAEFLVVNGHPAVKAAAPRFSLFDTYTDIAYPGGLHLIWFTREWGRFNAALDRNELPADEAGFMARLAIAGVRPVDADRDGALLTGALREHEANYDVQALALDHPHRGDITETGEAIDVFSPSTYVKAIDASGTAVYGYSGWLDGAYQHSAIKRHLTLKNPANRLILGPWSHGGAYTSSPANTGRGRFDHNAELLKFFDYYLKDLDTGLMDGKPVHYFTMAEEQWKAADAWPPPAEMIPFYFGAQGGLTREAPQLADAADTYEADYRHGTGHASRWNTLLTGGLVTYPDRAKQDERLLVYESAPLEADTEVTGHPLVTLHVASSADDGAFFVYLEDVDAAGEVAYVTEGQLRALHRKLGNDDPPYAQVVPYRTFSRTDTAPLLPGEPAELTFDLLPTSYLFRAGHRIRLAVACADSDHFALIPPTPPTITVYREARRPSHVALPIVSRND
jgi:putative CocE/NonD family hydrolase